MVKAIRSVIGCMLTIMLKHYRVATKGEPGETYNIGGHNEKQNIEVIEIICDILQELAQIQDLSQLDNIC